MKRKLGPLQLWQWAMIGAAVGLVVLYRRGHTGAASDVVAAATPSGAQYNPIDPTTGLPISGGISGGAGAPSIDTSALAAAIAAQMPPQQAPGGDLATTLSNFGSLETLLSGLSEIQGTPEPGNATETNTDTVKTQTGTKRATKKKPKKPTAKAKKKTHGGHANPGHQVTHHGGGRRTPSSSAPHNSRQHHNVQPPAHQRHDPTTHPSAQHPDAKIPHTPTSGPTPLPPKARRTPTSGPTPLPRRRPAPRKRRR